MFNSNTKVPVITDEVFQTIKYAVSDKLGNVNDKAVTELKAAKKALADYTGPTTDIVYRALETLIDSCTRTIEKNIEVRDKAMEWLDYYKSPPTVRAYTTNNTIVHPRSE